MRTRTATALALAVTTAVTLPLTATAGGAASGAPAPAPSTTAATTAASAPTAGPARIVSERRLGARTVELRVDSPALGASVPVRLLLPTRWAERPDRTWPVLYLLQGAHDDHTAWTRETDVEGFTRDKDVLTVLPSSGPTGIPTRWWNGGTGSPDYETFQTAELPSLLAREYRAGERRAVAGVSTGAYGAMAFAARHPGTYAAAAAYSGILHTRLPGVPALVSAIVARELLAPLSLWGSPLLQHGVWRANDPYAQAEKLRGTALYVSSGKGIVGGEGQWEGEVLESAVYPSVRSFTERLKRLGIPATTHLYPGGSHAWPYWEREFRASWPLLAGALELPAAQRSAHLDGERP